MKYPEMRNELVLYIKNLSDASYQEKCWVNKIFPEGVEHDELDLTIHFLFDDTDLSTEPESLIGVILSSEAEAKAVKAVCAKLDAIFDKHGYDMTDEEYINLPEWRDVISAANYANSVLNISL